MNNFKKHGPKSPFLIGNLEKGDTVTEAKQVSFVKNQLSMF